MKLADRYEERLATFTKWPYTTSSPEEMAAAGWVYKPSRSSRSRDKAKCSECRAWIPCGASSITPMKFHRLFEEDCPFAQELIENVQEFEEAKAEQARKAMEAQEALRLEEARIAAAEALEASRPKATANDIGFFDPTLMLDLPEHLYATSASFIDHMSTLPDYQEKSVLELLPKCLRGPAFTWFKDQDKAFTSLNSFKEALARAFPPQETEATSSISASAPASTPQSPPPQYHSCPECSASFSSLSRLLAHTQKGDCSKIACNQCEESFASNNKLHEHVRLLHSRPVSPPVSPPATPNRSPPSSPNSPPKFLRYPTAPPTPPRTPIQKPPKRSYMTIDDLFARFDGKKSLLAIQKSPRSPPTPPATPTAFKASKSKVFETKSDSAPRTAAPANRKSSVFKWASTRTPPATPTASKSSESSKSSLFKIRSTSASMSARKSIPNHVAPTSAQTAPGVFRFSSYKSISTLRISMSSSTPSRSSLLCALIRVTVEQLRMLIASHRPHRPLLK